LAAGWLADKQAEIARDDWIDPDAGKVTLGEYAARWITERTLSETTRERYEGILRNHIVDQIGELALGDIRPATVRRWRHERLESGAGQPTMAKAYRLLHAIFTTAMDDQIVRRNPCRIKGAADDTAPERSVLATKDVFAVADAIGDRYRMLVLLAAFTSLRFGELAALQRRDVDLAAGEVRVRQAQAELRKGQLLVKEPKSAAGKRIVAIPPTVLPQLAEHLREFAEDGATGLVFIGPLGGRLRRHNFRRLWLRALDDAGLSGAGVHFHDLRHTGNHLAAVTGASTKELMARMGHSSVRAALIYQHATRERDHEIARAMRIDGGRDGSAGASRDQEGHAGGTTGSASRDDPGA
jgi:integrase